MTPLEPTRGRGPYGGTVSVSRPTGEKSRTVGHFTKVET